MGNERSGRRKVERPQGLVLPKLGRTEDSIRRYLAAVAALVGGGELDPRVADTMIAAAKGALQALRQKHSRNEVEELAELVKQARAAVQAGLKHAAEDRLHLRDKDRETAPASEKH